jgi:hypothetical protein
MKQHTFTAADLQAFAQTWPCSGMLVAEEPLTFTFAENGDLVDVEGDQGNGYDESALVALSYDAQRALGFDLPHLRGQS